MSWNVTKNWDYATTDGALLPLPKVNFSGNYIEKSGEKGGITFTDTSAPLDRPSLTHLEFHQKSNVYQNTGIDRAYWAPSVRGIQLFVQSMDTYAVDDGTTKFYAPFKAYTSVQTLSHEAITADLVKDYFAFQVAKWFEMGLVTSDRIAAFMRGSLDLTK